MRNGAFYLAIIMLLVSAQTARAEDTISTKEMAKHLSFTARMLLNMLGDDRDSNGYDFTVVLKSGSAEKMRVIIEKSESEGVWRKMPYRPDLEKRGMNRFHRSRHDSAGCRPDAELCRYRISIKTDNKLEEERVDLSIWLKGRGTPVFRWGGYIGGETKNRTIGIFDGRKGKMK